MTTDGEKPLGISIERFEALVDAYGAQPNQWPEDEREPALALLADSPRAQEAVDHATALDGLLDEIPNVEPSAALQRQVLAAAPTRRLSWLERLDQFTRHLWPYTPRWQPGTGLVAAAAFGILVGAVVPDSAEASESVDVTDLAFGSESEWNTTDESELP